MALRRAIVARAGNPPRPRGGRFAQRTSALWSCAGSIRALMPVGGEPSQVVQIDIAVAIEVR